MMDSNSQQDKLFLKPQSVDLTSLAQALKFQDPGNFAWVQQLSPEHLISDSIYFEGKSHIKIPVSLSDFENLKFFSRDSLCGKGLNVGPNPALKLFKEIVLTSEKSLCLPFKNPDILASLVEHHLELPAGFDRSIAVQREKIVFFETGGHYQRNFQPSHSSDGKLATVTIQVPVEGGYDGGNIYVERNGQQNIFDLQIKDQEGLCMAVIFDCCDHWMEPITRGATLMFVYNVFWTNPKKEIPRDLPSFLVALKDVKKAMDCWNTEISPVQTQEEGDILYFTLEEQYDSSLTFQKLAGNDRNMALTFLNCPFLDVTFAQVSHRIEKIEQKVSCFQECSSPDCNENRKRNNSERRLKIVNRTEIVRWILPSDKPIHLTLELDWQKHYSGCGRNLLDVDQVQPVNRNNEWDFDSDLLVNGSAFLHSILIIWPTHRRFQMDCRYGLVSLLERLESCYSYAASEAVRHDVYLKLGHYLRQIVTASSNLTIQRLKNPTDHLKLMTRLLRFCTWSRARREGLAVLQIIANSTDQLSLQSLNAIIDDIGREIAEFQCQVAGWADCTDFVKRMINPHQIGIVSRMAKCFRVVNCTEGVKMLGDYVSSYMSQMSQNEAKDVKSHLNFILSLEEDPATSNQERLASFFTLFPKLPPSIQCQVVLDLEDTMEHHRLGKKKISQFKRFFECICESLSDCELFLEPVPTEKIIELILLFVRFGDEYLLRAFLSSLTREFDTASNEKEQLEERKWSSIGQLTESPIILHLAKSSDLGLFVFNHLVMYQFSGSDDERESLSSYLKFNIEVELTPSPPDPNLIPVLKSMTEKLSLDQLIGVLRDVLQTNWERLKNRLKLLQIIKNFCQMILFKVKEEVSLSALETIVNSWKLLDALNTNEDLVETIMGNLILSAWDQKNKERNLCDELIEKINRCVDIFFLTEKNQISYSKHKSGATPFFDLFVQLPLDVMMKAILQIYSKEFEKSDDIKKWPTCFDWLKNVLKFGLKKDFVSEFIAKNTSYAVNIVLCLLWMEDDDAWRCFATSVCHSSHFNILVEPFGIDLPTNHKDLMGRIANTCPAMEAFASISAQARIRSKEMDVPRFSWRQPTARLPKYPEVEEFLQSGIKSYVCRNFSKISEARDFARLLERTQVKNKFKVTTKVTGSGKLIRCLIRKDKSYHADHMRPFFKLLTGFKKLNSLKSQLENLCKTRSNIVIVDLASSDVDSVAQSPPFNSSASSSAKRAKI